MDEDMGRIDGLDLLGGVLGAVGGSGMALVVLGLGMDTLLMVALSWLVMPLIGASVLMPIARQRPWALTLSSAPLGLALFLTFGIVSLAGVGVAADRPAYIWGSLAAAVAFAAFSVYAHRDGMRRYG